MEFLHYRTDPTFQGSPTTIQSGVHEGHGDMSVEDLVLSMQKDLFVDSESTGSGSLSVHRQPGAVSLRINGVGRLHGVENEPGRINDGRIGHIISDGRCNDVEQYQQVEQQHQHDQKSLSTKPSSRGMIEDAPYSESVQQSPDTNSNEKPEIATQQHLVSNGFASHNHAQPQLASQFYQQLRMSWGPSQPGNFHQMTSPSTEHNQYSLHSPVRSSLSMSNGISRVEPEVGPRMLPKPPPEPRRGSRTRSSLRRAANLLLNRSRQSLSDGETTRKPAPPSTPRDEVVQKKETKSQTIRERLQKNKNKMGDLLRSPNLSRVRRPSQENISTDSSLSPSDMHQTTPGHRKYASAENLQGIRHHRSAENLSTKQTSKYARPESYNQSHEVISSRSDDNDEHDYMRGQSPGYKLRRHASGPVYQAADTSDKRNLHRGYHTADSDTDSGVGRVNMYGSQSQFRNDAHKAMPSTRDTLRMLSKKREVSGASSRHMSKSVSGPVRADHNIQPVSGVVKADYNIQPVRTADEWSQADKPDVWTEQGARPKRSSSVESLETEEVRHEIFLDTPIRVGHNSSYNSREEKDERHQKGSSRVKSDSDDRRSCSGSRPSSPSGSRPSSSGARPPSPSRSVHFEESHSSQDKHNETRPHSRLKSRTQRSPTCTDSSKHQTNATSVRSKSTFSNGLEDDAPINMNLKKNHQGNRNSDYSSMEDPYSTVTDHYSRVITDDNPYEEIQIPNQDVSKTQDRMPSRNPLNNNWNEMDSIDGLYAKVEKKRHRKKKECHNEKQRENGDGTRQKSTENSRDIPFQGSDNGEPIYAKVDKSKKKPPSGMKPNARHRSQSDVSSNSNGNPCVTNVFDDSISHVGADFSDDMAFKRNLEHYSDLSGSRLSITSRASISDKMQSIGKATKKKFTSMKRALSLDRIDTTGHGNDPQPKLKRSPSLRSLTGLFGKKDKKQDDSESPGKLNKRRSASVSGLHVRPQRTSKETDVTSPSHMRKVGKLLNINSDGSQFVELVKPPSGPFGFYIARGTSHNGSGVFVTRLGDGHPAKILAGLLAVGDEILDINGVDVRTRPIDDVYDMMMDNDKLILRLVPFAARSTYTK